METWGPSEVARRDAVRRFVVGVVLFVGFSALMAGMTLLLMRFVDFSWFVAPFVLAMTGTMMFLPLLWAVIVRELRRREVAGLYGIDLRCAQAVDMHVQVRGEDVGKDTGFIVFRQGTFAFFGQRSRFAFAVENTKFETDPGNHNRVQAVASHKHGQTHLLFVPSDRLVLKGGRVQKLVRDFSEHKRLDRPRQWFDVLPPAGIDPTIEVTEKDLGKVKRMWIAYAFLCSLPVLSIVINLIRGEGAFENFTLHSVIGPFTAYLDASRQSKTTRNRFIVHEEIRRGKVLPQSEAKPLEVSKVP